MTRLEALLARSAGQRVSLPPANSLHTTEPVQGEGPLDARIVILGESLGLEEVKARRPFVGATYVGTS